MDGDLDLYVANVANPNRLYKNEGSHFTDIGQIAGVSAPLNGSYVPFFFDSDSDGDLDIFVSSMAYYEDYVESVTKGEKDLEAGLISTGKRGQRSIHRTSRRCGFGILFWLYGSWIW